MLYLFCMKVKHPERITLIRGNHECRNTTKAYGFYDECLKKYGSLNVWRCVMDTFDHLNVAAVVSDQIFAVHGGLSPKIKDLKDINEINRKQELPEKGPFSDLLWSDPENVARWVPSHRGAGWLFGDDATSQFLHQNNLQLVVRAH